MRSGAGLAEYRSFFPYLPALRGHESWAIFSEIEVALGALLPSSAWRGLPSWVNEARHSQVAL